MGFFWLILIGSLFGIVSVPIHHLLVNLIGFIKSKPKRYLAMLVEVLLASAWYIGINFLIRTIVLNLFDLPKSSEISFIYSFIPFLMIGTLVDKFIVTPWLKKRYPNYREA